MLAYWSGFGRRLVFLTAQPEFANGGEPDLGLARLSERQELLDLLARQGALVVHTRELFCAIAPGCGFRDERGELLLIDGHHFTRRGAELFGQRLLDALQQP